MVDVRKERVQKEIEEKAQHLSLLWFMKNYEKVYKNPQLNPEQIPKNAEILYNEISENRKKMVQIQRQLAEEANLRRRPPKKEMPPLEYSREELSRGPMYPVPDEQKKLIYFGVSHNDEGRAAYLKARNCLRPEKKYYDPMTHAMDYGWEVEERGWRPCKEFVRTYVVKKSFYRRNGTLEGDDLMRRQPFSVAHKCFEIL